MAIRSAVIDFSLANKIYASAVVSFYTVNPSTGAKTTTLADLFAGPTGTTALANPQTLDSFGKWKQPVYIESAVIMVISGLTVGDHETGIVRPVGSWRGTWASAEYFFIGDEIKDGAAGANTKNLYRCLVDHTSGTWATDLAASRWELSVSVADVEAAAASAIAAQAAAEQAEADAILASAAADGSADAAATQASNATNSANAATAAQIAAEAARDATLAAYDNFDDRYLGPKASDPATDNDGNTLVGGALYFNTADGAMKIWTGAIWVAAYVSGTDFLARANNLSDVANTATAFSNIKQAATESASGVAEIATQPEVDAALDDERLVTPLKLHANRTGAATTSPATNDIINFLDASAGSSLKKTTIADILALTSSATDDDARFQALLNSLVERRKSGAQGGTGLVKGHVDAYLSDTIGSASTNETYDAAGDYYHNPGVYTADLTTGKTVSSVPVAGTPANAIDDNAGTKWSSGIAIVVGTDRIIVDFGAGNEKDITKITYKAPASYALQQGKLQWSTDGVSWSDSDTFAPANSTAVQEFTFAAIGAKKRYWSVLATDSAYGGAGYGFEIDEMEMMETSTPVNMTMTRGSAVVATATPTTAWVVSLVDPVSAVTYNTDYTIEVTSNNGTNWDAVTLTSVGSYDGAFDILVGKVTLTGGSTDMNYRKKTLNNKVLRDAGIAMMWG